MWCGRVFVRILENIFSDVRDYVKHLPLSEQYHKIAHNSREAAVLFKQIIKRGVGGDKTFSRQLM